MRVDVSPNLPRLCKWCKRYRRYGHEPTDCYHYIRCENAFRVGAVAMLRELKADGVIVEYETGDCEVSVSYVKDGE